MSSDKVAVNETPLVIYNNDWNVKPLIIYPSINPNGYMERPIREMFSEIVAPIAYGQPYNLNFTCAGEQQFEAVKVKLSEEFLGAGIFADASEFEITRLPTSHEASPYIPGKLVLKFTPGKYQQAELDRRGEIAMAYVAERTTKSRPADAVEQSLACAAD